eukprot:TRINITY_DN3090_c0_g2_i1.p5 TRINITY_DN3090_c0_g2~~TRINITY_DN3090_c0_g2_i1.p5  ORF type:complete len:175 (+),score=28.99 TRINITY_DN3090_c0_g2_i1:224-748(+)
MQTYQAMNKDLITLMFRGDEVIDQQRLTHTARSILSYLLAQQLFEIAVWVLQRCRQLQLPVVSSTLPDHLDALQLKNIIQEQQDVVEVGGQQSASAQVQLSQGHRDYSSPGGDPEVAPDLARPEEDQPSGSRHSPHPIREEEKEKKNQKSMSILGIHTFDTQVEGSGGQLWARS